MTRVPLDARSGSANSILTRLRLFQSHRHSILRKLVLPDCPFPLYCGQFDLTTHRLVVVPTRRIWRPPVIAAAAPHPTNDVVMPYVVGKPRFPTLIPDVSPNILRFDLPSVRKHPCRDNPVVIELVVVPGRDRDSVIGGIDHLVVIRRNER